jgi:Uma2 family endonuclease
MATSSAQTLRAYIPEYLPESDGEPMAETDKHRKQMIALLDCLDEYFRPRPDIYVSGNIFAYPPRDERGERRSVCPDLFVVRGIEKKDRRIYDMEVEGKAPELIIELVSRSTMIEDLGNKRVIYASLGVREYFLFDPLGEAFPSPLRGFRLEGNDYIPMMGSRLHSEVLGLDLVVEDGKLRLYDPKTGERLRTHEESEADRRKAEARAAKEAKARHAAETARQAAEAKAAQEAKAREMAEAEMTRLREELARLQSQKG